MRVAALLLAAGAWAWAASDVKEVQKTVPLAPGGRVSISTYKGTIRVSGWDNAQVEIKARIEPGGDRDADRRLVQDTEVRIDAFGDSVRIKSDYPDDRWFHFGNTNLPFVRYDIRMPRTARLAIKDYKSETIVSDLAADLEIDTYKGEVRVSRLAGGFDYQSHRGEARVEFAKLGPTSIDTYRGDVELRMPRASAFDLRTDLGRHARLDSDFPLVIRSTAGRERSFQGPVNGGGPRLRIKSYRGSFRLRVD